MKSTTPESHQKKMTKIGQLYDCHQTEESFDSSINGKLRVFQNHMKQAKINILFHCFPLLGLKNQNDFEFLKSVNFCP